MAVRRSRVVGSAVLVLLGLLLSSLPVGAVEKSPQRKKKRVALLPLKRLDIPCSALFEAPDVGSGNMRRLEHALRRELSQLEDVEVLSPAQLRKRISRSSSYRDKVLVGRERYLLGKELYEDLRQNEAEQNLLRAAELLQAIFYDLVEPDAFAKILLLLGTTHIEMNKAAEAHQAFKRANFLAPDGRFPGGYYPRQVEQAMLVSCEDLRQTTDREYPRGNLGRTREFMKAQKLDTLFYPLLQQGEERTELLLLGYERETATPVFRYLVPVGDEEGELDHISRAVSSWYACTPYRNVQKRIEESKDFVLSATYQHLGYLTYPTRTALSSMGISLDAAYFFRPSFALIGRAQAMSSLPDRLNDMLDGFTSARVIFGPAFSVSGTWWRLFIVPGAEFHYMGSFKVSRDPDCKLFKPGSNGYAQCDEGAVKHFPVDFLAGMNVYIGSQFFVSKDLFLGAGASVSTYFAPFDRSFELNFPIAVEAGGGIAF